jgi:hypothetical protein
VLLTVVPLVALLTVVPLVVLTVVAGTLIAEHFLLPQVDGQIFGKHIFLKQNLKKKLLR